MEWAWWDLRRWAGRAIVDLPLESDTPEYLNLSDSLLLRFGAYSVPWAVTFLFVYHGQS